MDFTSKVLHSSQALVLQNLLSQIPDSKISKYLANIYLLNSIALSDIVLSPFHKWTNWNNEKVSDLPEVIVGAGGTFTSIF